MLVVHAKGDFLDVRQVKANLMITRLEVLLGKDGGAIEFGE